MFAYLVILSHSFELVDGKPDRELLYRITHTATFGGYAVFGFFTISGLLITASYQNSASWRDYLTKRVLRIYPGYIVAFILSLFVLAPFVGGVLQLDSVAFWYRRVVRRMLSLGIPEVDGPVFPGNHSPLLNGAMWTIRYEFLAYLSVMVLGQLGWLARRRRALAATGALILFDTLLELMQVAGGPPVGPVFLVRFMMLFWAGAILHLYRDRIVYAGRYAAFALVGLALLLHFPRTVILGLATFNAYLIGWFAFAVRSRRLASIGTKYDLSYGVYLYGWPLQSTLIWLVPAMHPGVVALLTAVAASMLALASWLAVEQPALRFKSRFRRRSGGPPQPANGRL